MNQPTIGVWDAPEPKRELNGASTAERKTVMNDNLNFGQAIEAAKAGKRVARKAWNGAYVYLKQGHPVNGHLQPSHPHEAIPSENPDGTPNIPQGKSGQMLPYFVYKTVGDSVYWGEGYSDYLVWMPNTADILVEDWMILD